MNLKDLKLTDRQIVMNLLDHLDCAKENVKWVVEHDPEYTGLRIQWEIWILEDILGIPCKDRTDVGPLPPSRQSVKYNNE